MHYVHYVRSPPLKRLCVNQWVRSGMLHQCSLQPMGRQPKVIYVRKELRTYNTSRIRVQSPLDCTSTGLTHRPFEAFNAISCVAFCSGLQSIPIWTSRIVFNVRVCWSVPFYLPSFHLLKGSSFHLSDRGTDAQWDTSLGGGGRCTV